MGYDSISNFQGNNDRYNINSFNKLNDPNEVLREFRLPTSRDTIETSSVKIEKEVTEKFHANNFQLPNERMVPLARAGKFLFMAVALPPFVMLYTIPKWIATHIIPQMNQFIGNNVRSLFHPVEQIAMFFNHQFQKLLKTFKLSMQKISKAFNYMAGFLSLLKYPREILQNMWNGVKRRLSGGQQWLKGAVDDTKAKLKAKLLALLAELTRRAKKAALGRTSKDEPLPAWRQKILDAYNTIKTTLQYILAIPGKITEKIQQVISDRYYKHIHPYVLTAQRYYTATSTWISNKTAFAREICKKALQHAQKAAKTVASMMKAALHFADQSVGISEGIKQVLGVFSWIAQTLQSTRNTAKSLQNKGSQTTKKALSTVKQSMLNAAKTAGSLLLNSIALPFGRALLKTLTSPRKTLKAAKESIKKLLNKARLKVAATKDRFSNLPLQWFKSKKQTKEKISKKWQDYRDSYRRAVYLTKLSGAWVKVLTRFWLNSVRDISENLVDHITWADIKYAIKAAAKAVQRFVTRQLKRLANYQIPLRSR